MAIASDVDLYAVVRGLNRLPADGCLGRASPATQRVHGLLLAEADPDRRRLLVEGWRSAMPDPRAVLDRMMAIDPAAGPPEAEIEAAPLCRVLRAADVRTASIEWLWGDRLPSRMLSLVAGAPKTGKSLVTVALASAVSRGSPLPGEARGKPPRHALVMCAEDSAAHTIVPRLKAAGADLERVHILESVVLENGREALPSLACDVDRIAGAIRRIGDVALLTIDPISAFLGRTDDHKNAELRGVLSPLKQMVEDLGPACSLVTHLNKGGAGGAQSRVMGSTAYVGACRANFMTVRDRDDPTGRRVLLCDLGGNLAPPAPTLAYRVEARDGVPTIEWEQAPVDVTADEALAREREALETARDAPALREAEEFLASILKERGTVPVNDIQAEAKRAALSWDAVKRAKESLNIVAVHEGFGPGSKWLWRMR